MNNILAKTHLITAIITPFDNNNQINFSAYKKIINSQIKMGVEGFAVAATTGEAPTLNENEKLRLFKKTVEFVKGRAKIIANVGTNNTKETIDFVKKAEKISGIDAFLTVNPYYNKPDQLGMIKHFESIADNSKLPIIIYNIPSRTSVALTVNSLIELSRYRNIIGVKQCTTDYDMSELIEKTDKNFLVYTGEDGQSFFNYALGGAGTISVISHFYAKNMVKMLGILYQIKKV